MALGDTSYSDNVRRAKIAKYAAQNEMDARAAEVLGLGTLDEVTRTRYVPIAPFCITREVRKGVAGFRTTDMRTNRSVRVPTKRDATRVAKMIEADYYRKGGAQ